MGFLMDATPEERIVTFIVLTVLLAVVGIYDLIDKRRKNRK
ncbi:MAG: hypothetical protein A4E56_01479 [Pelotomaculum sp. PtaU1.Bin065]|nr:MAG: hypothetical protein A4E56_01479 [Pelotomaculum sp. PtaU1.Bin065]